MVMPVVDNWSKFETSLPRSHTASPASSLSSVSSGFWVSSTQSSESSVDEHSNVDYPVLAENSGRHTSSRRRSRPLPTPPRTHSRTDSLRCRSLRPLPTPPSSRAQSPVPMRRTALFSRPLPNPEQYISAPITANAEGYFKDASLVPNDYTRCQSLAAQRPKVPILSIITIGNTNSSLGNDFVQSPATSFISPMVFNTNPIWSTPRERVSKALFELGYREAPSSLRDENSDYVVFIEDESPPSSDDELWSFVNDENRHVDSFRGSLQRPGNRYSRKWVKEKKGKRWTENNIDEILQALRRL
ncbi:hypothetical protein C8Q75DRAFT_537041 [Abortiporus biennis]|nr:hypothetical protein C8Q75DRAFT_537041 [Abortiporus biennis]